MAISKTDYLRGIQCERMLWLDKNFPEKKIIPKDVLERLQRGNDFGDKAMGMFGEYLEVCAQKSDGSPDFSAMIKLTQEYLKSGVAVICEASFSYKGGFCAVDILRKEGEEYCVYEVKNSSEVKEVFLQDLGFQAYVLYKCGIKCKSYYIVTNDGNDGFTVNDVSKDVQKYKYTASKKIWEMFSVKYSKKEIVKPVGEQCGFPYKCWYYNFCHEVKAPDETEENSETKTNVDGQMEFKL